MIIFIRFLRCLKFLDHFLLKNIFWIFSISFYYLGFLDIFFFVFLIFSVIIDKKILLKDTKVTTGHQKRPKNSKICYFFIRSAK